MLYGALGSPANIYVVFNVIQYPIKVHPSDCCSHGQIHGDLHWKVLSLKMAR